MSRPALLRRGENRRPVRVIAAVAAASALALGSAGLGASAALAADAPISIDVVSFNDFHGRLEASGASAGAAVLGGLVDKFRAANPNTLVVSAGDNVGASTFTSFVQNDEPTLAALNAMKVDVSVLGNHEFDQGRNDVDTRLVRESDFPYISANLIDKATGKPAWAPYFEKTIDGVRVAVIGATTEDLPILVSPAGISTLNIAPVVSSVNAVAARLRDGDAANGEADVVLLAVHEGPESGDIAGAEDDSAFGKIVQGTGANVDAIIGAHTHQLFDQNVPIASTGKTIPVYESAKYGEQYGHLAIQVDPTTHKLISIDGEVKPLVGSAAPNAAITKIVTDAVAVAAVKGRVSLGSITADLTRGKKADGTENRGAESTLSNLLADVQLAATKDKGAQLGLMNPGGVRTDLLYKSTGADDPDGNVTYAEAATVQPFSNTLVTEDITGAQLKTVLEQQWQPGSSRPYLKLGLSKGLTYTYDPAAAQGSKVANLALNGAPIAPTATVKIVTNSFLAAGGDGFLELAKGTNSADTGLVDLATFVDYMKTRSPASPDLAQRSIGATLSAPAAAGGYAPGENVTATLSSMLFTNGGPTSGDAYVKLGETVLGSAPLSYTVAPTEGDEQGSATVSFTIPSGVTGTQTLTISGPGGTAIPVPITVKAPVATTTTGSLTTWFSLTGRGVVGTVKVSAADASAPVGTVEVLDNGRVIATVPLAASAAGSARITLPKLSRGVHLLQARFSGSGYVSSASSQGLVFVLL